MRQNIFAIYVFLCAAAVAAGAARKFKFDDFYNGGDGLDAMAKLVESVKKLNGEPAVVEFAKKEYRFGKSKDINAFIALDGFENVVFDGGGALVEIDPYNAFADIRNSKNITIKNFTTRYSKKDFTQGAVENNVLDNPTCGFWISNEAGSFHEGPIPANITIRNNVFKNVRRYAVSVSAINTQKNFVPQLRGIHFENNVFYASEQSGGKVVLISNGQGFTFKNETYMEADGAKIEPALAVAKFGKAK